MSIGHNTDTSGPDARLWTQILSRYREPSRTRSVIELVVTALPLVALWVAAWLAYSFGFWWLSLLIAIPASGFLVRLFMIQHDCGHGSFFRNKHANDWVGRVLGVLTMTPYDFWRRTHAVHHATSGNLDSRGMGDVDTLTVREYRALSRLGRLKYRLYRNPLVMFGVGPAYLFLLRHRLPIGLMRAGWRPWISTQATNAAIAAIALVLIWLIGVGAFFTVQAALADVTRASDRPRRIVFIASTAGLKGYPYVAAYVAAKHGVVGLARSLGLELAATGVTVNAVCPGYTDTSLLDEAAAKISAKTGRSARESRAQLAKDNAHGQLITPDEVAHKVLWLCSPAAAAINGQAIEVTGATQ
mgnify:CR=1 FL=1